MKSRVLVTGATGFVGGALLRRLVQDGDRQVLAGVRQSNPALDPSITVLPISPYQDVDAAAMADIDVIVHCAARVHVMRDTNVDPLMEFRKINVDWTLRLAEMASFTKVRRFVYVSSIKVNGERTPDGRWFTADDVPEPTDPYGISKLEAERGLMKIANKTGLEVVIVRPPLVYGPGVKANFAAMMRWLARGIPLPLGSITHNRRSLVALDNLVDLLMTCISHPAAANHTFLVCDNEDMSTTDLLRRLGVALNKPARLLPVPPPILKFGTDLVGKPGLYQRLCGSLQLDISKTTQLLGWLPPITVDEGLRRAAMEFVE